MVAALRSYCSAGLAITTAGLVAVVPPAPALRAAPEIATVSLDARLSAGESLLNVPLNLLQALINIPANEIHALDVLGQSLLFTGQWFVSSPTNIWGEDPGDPGHFESVAQLLFPFPVLSGAGHEGDYSYPGLGQQLAMWAAVQIPANQSCASLDCLPAVPTSPITGFTAIDQLIWPLLIATGLQYFPLIQNWFQVSDSEMTEGNGYYFDPNSPGALNSGVAHDGYLWEGSRTLEQLGLNPEDYPNIDPNAPLQPWTGSYYKMDFETPFTNFFNSLMEPFDASKFEFPDLGEFARAVQTVVAGSLIDFNPFVPGSPLCPGPCLLLNPGGNIFEPEDWNTPSFWWAVKLIDELWPGNEAIGTWLSDYDNGTANVSTPEIINYAIEAWRLGGVVLDIGNPLPPNPFIDTSDWLPTVDQVHDFLGDYLFNIADNIGLIGPFDIQGLWDAIFDVTPAA